MTNAELAASAVAAFRCPYRSTLLRGLIWAFSGLSYGFVFLFLYHALDERLPPYWLQLLVAMGTGGLVALIYGSLRLSMLVTLYAGVTAIGYLIYASVEARLSTLLPIGAVTGMAIGLGYGMMVRDSRIHCAEAKIISGIVAGAAAALLSGTLILMNVELSLTAMVFLLCPLTGLLYAVLVRWVIAFCSHLVPASLNGALVGLGSGTVASLMMWVIFSSLSDNWLAEHQRYATQIMEHWPPVVASAMVGAFFVGLFRAGIGARWLDV